MRIRRMYAYLITASLARSPAAVDIYTYIYMSTGGWLDFLNGFRVREKHFRQVTVPTKTEIEFRRMLLPTSQRPRNLKKQWLGHNEAK